MTGYAYDLSVDYDTTDVNNIMDIYIYLIVIKWVEMIFGLVGQAIIGLLRFIKSLAAKCIRLNNKPCIASSTFRDLTPNKYSLALRHYPYLVI